MTTHQLRELLARVQCLAEEAAASVAGETTVATTTLEDIAEALRSYAAVQRNVMALLSVSSAPAGEATP